MKFLKQFLIILVITFMGEGLKYLLPLPIPASIYGMVLLFLALMTGIVKLESVRDAGKFLIEIMPVMFIPAGVGLMVSWGVAQAYVAPGRPDYSRQSDHCCCGDRIGITNCDPKRAEKDRKSRRKGAGR